VKFRLLTVVFVLLLAVTESFAGGPLYVGNDGVPQTWANGQISYYTDQGDLSSLLPSAQADQFVVDAWSRWTSVPLAALSATRAGQLDEDVTGSNFATAADVAKDSSKPVAIVYDKDGSVMEALFGQGAGAYELCSTNAVFGQVDRIGDDGHLAHAVVVINGNCAQWATDLPFLHYQLVRVLGRILGLDYSQLNENIVTGAPAPTMDDYAGYPVMHPLGVVCTQLSCMSNADVPRMDDRAALARLYPSPNFIASTVRVRGVIRFPSWRGASGQGMQGVNVVARLIDPTSGRVSGRYAASCVSGFLFRGNGGNPMTGYVNGLGIRWDSQGSSDTSLEGYYDFPGLEVPNGYDSATYEISVEPVNALYTASTAVGRYVAGQVHAAGSAAKLRLTISKGTDVEQDFVMEGAAAEPADRWEPSSFSVPRPVPLAGTWTASLSGYGDRDYYSFHAEANRTFTFDVTAVDQTGAPTADLALPVVGAWAAGDPEGAPEVHETFFNSSATATTRLQVESSGSGSFKVGVADYRGDGRPDFRYTARLLYADKLIPARVSVQGGSVVIIEGLGFTNTTQVSIGDSPVAATPVAADQIAFRAPALSDGKYDITVSDSQTGATSHIIGGLVVGAANAKLVLLNGANPQVPVGTVAPNSISVQVLDDDDGTPGPGATVSFSAPASVGIVGCSASPCTVVTDQTGTASVQVLVKQAGASTITAKLPAGGSVSGTVNGLAAPTEITVAQPIIYVPAGATTSVPIAATVVQNGVPTAGVTVNFLMNYGAAVISPASSNTNAAGVAISAVAVTALNSDVNLSACIAPANAPCRTVVIHPIPNSALRLQKISGDGQSIAVGEKFAAVVLRVTDAIGDPLAGVPVTFEVHVNEAPTNTLQVATGELVTTHYAALVSLSSSMTTLASDTNGLVTLPAVTVPAQPVQVTIRATAGLTEADAALTSMWANLPSTSTPASVNVVTPNRLPLRTIRTRKVRLRPTLK
jgi:hypothetical protein